MTAILNNILNYFIGGYDYLVKALLFVLVAHTITQIIVNKKVTIDVITDKIGYIIALMVLNVVGAFTQQAGWAVVASIRLLGGSYIIVVQACEIFDDLKKLGVEIEFVTNFFEKLKSIISSQTIINDGDNKTVKIDNITDDIENSTENESGLKQLVTGLYKVFSK